MTKEVKIGKSILKFEEVDGGFVMGNLDPFEKIELEFVSMSANSTDQEKTINKLNERIDALEKEDEDDSDDMSEDARLRFKKLEEFNFKLLNERKEEKRQRRLEQVAGIITKAENARDSQGHGFTRPFIAVAQSVLLQREFFVRENESIKLESGDENDPAKLNAYYSEAVKLMVETGLDRVKHEGETEREQTRSLEQKTETEQKEMEEEIKKAGKDMQRMGG